MTTVAKWNVHNINVSTLVFCRVKMAGVVQIPPGGFAVDFSIDNLGSKHAKTASGRAPTRYSIICFG